MAESKKGISRRTPLILLQHSATMIDTWLTTVLARGPEFSFSEQDCIAFITSTEPFKCFLSSASSGALLINGNTGSHTGITSISFLSAMITQFVRKTDAAVSASYFCSIVTTDNNDEDLLEGGPTAMLRSLVAQVASRQAKFVEGIERMNIDNPDINELLTPLDKLLRNLPSKSVVFLIIDSISSFDIAEWSGDTGVIMSGLLDLVNSSHCILKVHITSPTVAVQVLQMMDEDEVLHVPKDIVNRRGMGFGAAQFERSAWLPNTENREDNDAKESESQSESEEEKA